MMKNHQYSFEVVEPHISSLYNTALRMSGNIDDASILVQNTFRKAIESSDNFKQIGDFKVWIFKGLIKTFISNNRNKNLDIIKPEVNDELDEFYLFRKLDETMSIQERTKEDILENFYEKDVKAAIEKLPYQFRLMVLLCDIEGFSYNETATIIDASLSTVISRLYHGRKLFQRNLWHFVKEQS
jgi:RNA polymerase sigma-70 factor (ECF subfamily)